MNRWWGTSADSTKQSSERDQRAARREVNNLNLFLSDDDDDYQECNTSVHNRSIFSLDGAADRDSLTEDESEDTMVLTAAELAAEKAKPIEDADFPDDADAWKKEVKVKFDQSDVKYWFNDVEDQMKRFGINSQWSKKAAIKELLPQEVIEECKPILRLTQTEAGDTIYKDLKTEILNLYGEREEEAYAKASALTLASCGKPSALGKRLVHLLCPGAKPFEGCHCAKIVFGMHRGLGV